MVLEKQLLSFRCSSGGLGELPGQRKILYRSERHMEKPLSVLKFGDNEAAPSIHVTQFYLGKSPLS